MKFFLTILLSSLMLHLGCVFNSTTKLLKKSVNVARLMTQQRMKCIICIAYLLNIILFAGCVFNSSASLLKKANCSEIQTTGLIYAIKYKAKPLNLPAELVRNQNEFISPFFRLEFKSNELNKFEKDYCKIIEDLKNGHLRKRIYPLFKNKAENLIKDSIHLHFLSILLIRKNDELAITPINGSFEFIYNGSTYRGLSNHSDKLWDYASENFFDNIEIQVKLIDLANKMIVYRNAKVRSDITLSDSLRQPYPLIILPK